MLNFNIKWMKIRSISLILCLFLVCLLSGCKAGITFNETKDNEITLTPKAVPSNDETVPTVAFPEPTKSIGASDGTSEGVSNENQVTVALTDDSENKDPKLEEFSAMDVYFKDYFFDVSYDEKLEYYERNYTIHGEYDLDGDGEVDSINALLKANYEEGNYIEVNDIRVNIVSGNPSGEIRIMDIDNKDSYTEVAVFDEGPSGDPTLIFFRYDGKKLDLVGSIDQFALMDGKGKFISGFHLTNYFKPQFFSAWGEFKDKKYTLTNHDVEQYIGKTYVVDGTGFFVPLDEKPTNYLEHTLWDWEAQREFEATKIKLLDIHINPEDRTLNWFYVELPEGERGLLYFWIGD